MTRAELFSLTLAKDKISPISLLKPAGPATKALCSMTTSGEMTPNDIKRVKLEVLRRQHRDLDDAIKALQETGTADGFTLKRLKKQKLQLKDKISVIENQVTPDIIA